MYYSFIFTSIRSDMFGSSSQTLQKGEKCAGTLLVNGFSRPCKVITKLQSKAFEYIFSENHDKKIVFK